MADLPAVIPVPSTTYNVALACMNAHNTSPRNVEFNVESEGGGDIIDICAPFFPFDVVASEAGRWCDDRDVNSWIRPASPIFLRRSLSVAIAGRKRAADLMWLGEGCVSSTAVATTTMESDNNKQGNKDDNNDTMQNLRCVPRIATSPTLVHLSRCSASLLAPLAARRA